jgi:1-acyl-sn-glycerol-3-phosphate acyltransferase
VVYHDPLPVADYANRKSLALACETAVRSGHDFSRPEQDR